jgi:dihydropyrimidine dehydrogenase (NAD+) subunit PreT
MGGVPPAIDLLSQSGVSFDPSLRAAAEPVQEQGTGLLQALAIGFVLALLTLLFALWHSDYYLLSSVERPTHPKHNLLRPGMGLGLWLGIASTAFILINLLYVLRRSTKNRFQWGSLQLWMTSHIATGLFALMTAVLHSSMAPGDSPGGRAFWALAVLIVTGAIGRYFYAYVPRATNGRELDLAEARAQLETLSEECTGEERSFRKQALEEVSGLLDRRQWKQSFVGRARAILGLSLGMRQIAKRIQLFGAERGIPEAQVQEVVALARRAHSASIWVGHFEDLRAVLATWRYVHRWATVFMLLLLVVHIIHALSFAAAGGGGLR